MPGFRFPWMGLHSIRGEGYLAEQSVAYSLPGETLEITHRTIDRRCFMEGITFAIRNINRIKGLRTGLDTLMEL